MLKIIVFIASGNGNGNCQGKCKSELLSQLVQLKKIIIIEAEATAPIFHFFPATFFFVTVRLFPSWSDLLILHHSGLRHGGPAPSRVPQDVPLWQTDGLLVSWLLPLN